MYHHPLCLASATGAANKCLSAQTAVCSSISTVSLSSNSSTFHRNLLDLQYARILTTSGSIVAREDTGALGKRDGAEDFISQSTATRSPAQVLSTMVQSKIVSTLKIVARPLTTFRPLAFQPFLCAQCPLINCAQCPQCIPARFALRVVVDKTLSNIQRLRRWQILCESDDDH
jgi:hypothetical protein